MDVKLTSAALITTRK